MESDGSIINLLLNLGISYEEIDTLGIQKCISYIQYHYDKKDGRPSILFRGFSMDETIKLTTIAKVNNLLVKLNPVLNLTFLCSLRKENLKYVETARSNGTIILNKEEFETIFLKEEATYDLLNDEFLYDRAVPIEFRIARPLGNFNDVVKVKSFSFGSDKVYDLNLFKMTCSCLDFQEGDRFRYVRGDVRRLCKHLMVHYKNRFGLFGLSAFIVQAFGNSYPIKRNLKNVILESYGFEIVVNYDDNNSWWAVYVQDKNGLYSRYGYNPVEKRFSFFEKPYGLVTALKPKFEEIHKELLKGNPIKISRKNGPADDIVYAEHDGCVYLFIIALIILILSWIF